MTWSAVLKKAASYWVAAASRSTILTAIAACVTTNGEFDAPLETVQVNDTGHQRGQQRWLWVTRPDSYLDENGADRDDLDPGIAPDAGDWWTCHKDTGRGDLVLLYRTRPRSDIAYVIRAESEAYPLEGDEYAMERGWDYGCDYRVLYKFRKPLTLADLRSDPYLNEWGALRSNFQRRVYRIPAPAWQRLVKLIVGREPAAGRPLTPTTRRDRRVLSEKEIEDRIEANPAILNPFGYRLQIRDRQLVCGSHGGRIDLLGYDRREQRYVVIELKNVRAGQNTFGQISSYMGWVQQHIAGRRRVRGLVIARGVDTRFESAVKTNPWIENVDLKELGFAD